MIENRESGPTWLGAKGGGALGIAPAGVEREGDDGTLTGASLGALGAASIALVELVAKADKRVTHLVRSRAPC